MGVVIPHKKRNCNNCREDTFCNECDKLLIQNKGFSADPNEVKRQTANEIGQILPRCKEK